MCTRWCDGLMHNAKLRQVGQQPESWPISNQIAGVTVVENHQASQEVTNDVSKGIEKVG